MKETVQGDYTFLDFDNGNKTKNSRRIAVCPKYGQLTLSKPMSEKIHDKLGDCFMRVRIDNLTDQVYFVFNQLQGCRVNTSAKKNCVITCKELIQWLGRRYNNQETFYIRASEDMSNSSDYVTYKIDIA